MSQVSGPEAEDSLENTFSCVPKVQGSGAESLRQTDGDAKRLIAVLEQSLMYGLLFLYYFRKRKSDYVRKTH